MRVLRNIDEIIELSINHSAENEYYECSLKINGHRAHEVSIFYFLPIKVR